uniref:Uncharacterized protein n=1 Tax=Brassica campestris TaxID=3711 RepID=A0A3P6CA50_BRACM|nr:unnamed protein product [Brassica rapa]
MSQEDDIDVTPLSHSRIEHKRSYLWAEKPMGSLNSDWFLQKIGQIWVESDNCTLKQSQFRSLVVKAASVVAPKYTSIKPLGDRILVKIKEAEEKTMGGILLPSTGQRSRRQRRRQWEVSYFHLQVNRNLKEVKSLLWVKGELLGKTKLISLSLLTGAQIIYSTGTLELRWSSTM